jgi:hypothetical protein
MRALTLVLASAVVFVSAAASDTSTNEATVRVLCQFEWRDDMLQQPPPESGRSFDTALPFSALPVEATIADLVLVAEKRAGRRILGDFINTFRIYRYDEATHTYRRIEKRRLRDAETFRPHLQDRDIVVFHGIYDRF